MAAEYFSLAAGTDIGYQHLLDHALLPRVAKRLEERLRALDARTRQYGIQVVDLRLARVLLDEGSLRSAYDRMRLRHEGSLAEIEKRSADDALSIASSAEADATARRKLSSDKDPQFYSFFRAMRSYDELYGDPKRKNATTIILPPDSGYLKHFGGN